ncbi:MAG: hypothetical protein NTV02_02055 [Candidatus Zambryskibacteria bacterium]|nr:hypothetical protein [Candidatus Zambryskibacteria bacterium]
MFDFIDTKTLYTIVHVFGAIIGAGGAFVSDGVFFDTIKDGRITKRELDFMKLGGKFVWAGISVLFVSGTLIFLTDPAQYLASAKFLAKVTIVGVIVLNGIIFHTIHIPHIQDHLGLKLKESKTFLKKSSLIIASGAVSFVSWVFTVVLGSLRSVPYSYTDILSVYAVCVILAVLGACTLKKRFFKIKK